jgi:type I restriction enzyme S subunit
MSWKRTALANVAEIIAGQSPESKYYNNTGQGIPFFQGKADFSIDYPIVRYWCTQPTKIAKPLDILMSVRAPVGPTNICNIEACIGRGLAAIRVGKELDYKYLYFYFKSVEEKIAAQGNGSTFSAITTAVLKELQIPLPPLPIQKRIAEILDAADALKRKDQELLKKYDELAQAIFIDMFGDTLKNEKGWDVTEMRNIVHPDRIITYGIVQAGEHVPNGVPYIRTGDIKDGEILVGQLQRTSLEIAKSYARSQLYENDIVMSIRATVGTVALLPSELVGGNLTQGTARISPSDLVHRLYLYFYLKNDFAQSWIASNSKGATFREITLGKLRELPVLVPPIEMQKLFAERIENIQMQRLPLKLVVYNSKQLFGTLIQNAFNGELAA